MDSTLDLWAGRTLAVSSAMSLKEGSRTAHCPAFILFLKHRSLRSRPQEYSVQHRRPLRHLLKLALIWTVAVCAMSTDASAQAGREDTVFRWASQGELNTLDPHVLNEGLTSSLLSQVYEGLTCRDAQMRLVGCLAASWSQPKANEWLFRLRDKVKFHDGSELSAGDVVFSLGRARASSSPFQIYLSTVDRIISPQPGWVSITTRGTNPILPEQLSEVRVLSAAWAKKNAVAVVPEVGLRAPSFTSFNAMGTGPYKVIGHQVGVETSFKPFAGWWNQRQRRNSIAEIRYISIANASTRIAALISGEIDFVLDPPLQDIERLRSDPRLRVVTGNEIRTIYLGFDQFSEQLRYSDVAGNPFKDLRVRKAFYQAIDIEALIRVVMRGYATPAGLMVPPQVFGYDKSIDVRLPFDLAAARKLMVEAGFSTGFDVTLDCPNNRYVNDERVCVTIAQMLAKIGVRVRVNAIPRTMYFPKLQSYDTSFFLFGAGSPTLDGHYTLQALMRTRSAGDDGLWNIGGYSNPQVDARTERAAVESNRELRFQLIRDAFNIHARDVGHLPLYHQIIPWAVKGSFDVVHRADNRLEFAMIRKSDAR